MCSEQPVPVMIPGQSACSPAFTVSLLAGRGVLSVGITQAQQSQRRLRLCPSPEFERTDKYHNLNGPESAQAAGPASTSEPQSHTESSTEASPRVGPGSQ